MKALKFVGKTVIGTILVIVVTLVVLGSCTAAVFNHADDTAITTSHTDKQKESKGTSDKPKTDADKSKEQLHKEAGEPDEKVSQEFQNAVGSAQSYSDVTSMSKEGIIKQLEQFDQYPEDAAKYAVEHIDVDWNENALKTAKNYQETLNMSNDGLKDQLINFEYFTEDQAQYAIDNLDK